MGRHWPIVSDGARSRCKRRWPIARQIADGLEAAHHRGIVHRDLKPANVKIRPDGTVKLLDFGLAKALDGEPAAGEASDDIQQAATRTIDATREGVILGTTLYMSPEQACGKPVDKRTDVWAFGCVLFECLSGRRVFQRPSITETLAAIVDQEPDWSRLPASTPASIRRLLRRCLNKDPRLRLQDVGDARIEIDEQVAGLDESDEAGPAQGAESRNPIRLVLLLLAAATIGAVVSGVWRNLSTTEKQSMIRQQRLTEFAGIEETPAVSPDGNAIAFVASVDGRRQVFVRLLDRGSPVQVTREPAHHSFPRWADEDTLIYYVHPENNGEHGSLWETLVLSSTLPRRIGPGEGGVDVNRAGDTIATFRIDSEGAALVLIDRKGDSPDIVRRLPRGTYRYPRWSPDGASIAFQVELGFNLSEVRTLSLDGGEAVTVVSAGWLRGLAWLPDGSGLVYASSEGSTLAYPPTFSLRTVRIDGSHNVQVPAGDAGYASLVEPDVTPEGTLVASRVALESDIFRFAVDGSPLENTNNAERITRQTGQVQTPSVSPGGEEVVYLSDSGGHANVWITRVDGSHPPRQITNEHDPTVVIGIPRWSPRGDRIVFIRHQSGVGGEEWLVNPDGSDARPLVAGVGAAWSDDGEWIYYTTVDTVTAPVPCIEKVHIDNAATSVPVRCGAVGMQVTSDGKTAYFSPSVNRQGEVWMAAPPDTGAAKPLVTTLQSRIPLLPHQYDLSPDDRWLATPLMDGGTTNLWLVSTADGTLRQVTDFEQRSTMIARQVSWSRDGKSLFAAVGEMDADIVLLEGVLP